MSQPLTRQQRESIALFPFEKRKFAAITEINLKPNKIGPLEPLDERVPLGCGLDPSNSSH